MSCSTNHYFLERLPELRQLHKAPCQRPGSTNLDVDMLNYHAELSCLELA
jgi:hypothetical protein